MSIRFIANIKTTMPIQDWVTFTNLQDHSVRWSPLTKPISLFSARRQRRLLKQRRDQILHCCSKLCYNLSFWRQSTEQKKSSSWCKWIPFGQTKEEPYRRELTLSSSKGYRSNNCHIIILAQGQISAILTCYECAQLYCAICFDVTGINYYSFPYRNECEPFYFCVEYSHRLWAFNSFSWFKRG